MDITADINAIKELVSTANNILIVTHGVPSMDSMGSALALYAGLTGMGKHVVVATPTPMIVEFSNFVGADKVVTAIGKKAFVISLDYVEGSIEKVSYNIEGNKFNLVIEPRGGFDGFSQDQVTYTQSGAAFDLIFACDTVNLGELGKLYEENKALFADKPIINIDTRSTNARYGKINLIDPLAVGTVELISVVMSGIGIKLTADIATNLLNALYGATEHFMGRVTARAFEIAAICIKAGAIRFDQKQTAQPLPAVQPIADQQKTETHSTSSGQVPAASPSIQAPEEWLKPKIFKSSNIPVS